MSETRYMAEIRIANVPVGAVVAENFGYQFMYDSTQVMNTVLGHMGFANVQEYMSIYPGSFARWFGTGVQQGMVSSSASMKSEKELFICDYTNIRYVAPYYNGDNVAERFNEFNDHAKAMAACGIDGNGMFALPLEVKEVKKCLMFTEVPESKMWYCIDWKG